MVSVPTAPSSELAFVWHHLTADSCPYHYNFHLHTTRSDGQLEPEQIMQQALDHGLKGLAITDHHCQDAYKDALHWLERHQIEHDRLTLWPGIEISAELMGIEVHILGYDFDVDADCLTPYSQGHSVKGSDLYPAITAIAHIHQAGGLAVLAHPERYRTPSEQLIPAAVECAIDGIEVFYNYRRTDPWQATPKKLPELQAMAEKYNLFATCGTDTHGTDILLRV